MKKTEIAYAAGLIDGEGTIRLHRRESPNGLLSYAPTISLSLTVEYIPRWLQFHFGGIVYIRWQKNIPLNCKQQWIWMVRSDVAYACLKALFPFLILKKGHAEIAIKVWKDHVKWKHLDPVERDLQHILDQKMRILNKK